MLPPRERILERTCEQVVVEQVLEVPKTASRDRTLQDTVERVLDVPLPEVVKQLVKLPKTVSEDGIQQRTVERIADIPVPQVVEELVEVFLLQIVEEIDEKTVEVPQAQFVDKAVDTPVGVQRQVPLIQTVQTLEVPPLQFIGTAVDIPVVAQRQAHLNRNVQETIEVPQLQSPDEVVDVLSCWSHRFHRCRSWWGQLRGVAQNIHIDSFMDDFGSVDSKGLNHQDCERLFRVSKQSLDIAGGVHVGIDDLFWLFHPHGETSVYDDGHVDAQQPHRRKQHHSN